MIIQEYVRGLVYRYETSDRLDAIWSSLSEKARYEIIKNNMWFNDSLFERTPEEINRFLEDEWSDDDDDDDDEDDATIVYLSKGNPKDTNRNGEKYDA